MEIKNIVFIPMLASIYKMRILALIIILTFTIQSCSTTRVKLLPEGIWVSTKDSLAYIVTKRDTWIFKYKNDVETEERIHNYRILDSLLINGKFEKGNFLILTDGKDNLSYSGLKFDSESISMFYIPRGNHHEYHKID